MDATELFTQIVNARSVPNAKFTEIFSLLNRSQ